MKVNGDKEPTVRVQVGKDEFKIKASKRGLEITKEKGKISSTQDGNKVVIR